MTQGEAGDVASIRLVFELSRQDHPRLYDDLIRFPKGTKRINRLRVLAYDGLLVQSGVMALESPGLHVTPESASPGNAGEAITNDLFGPGVQD